VRSTANLKFLVPGWRLWRPVGFSWLPVRILIAVVHCVAEGLRWLWEVPCMTRKRARGEGCFAAIVSMRVGIFLCPTKCHKGRLPLFRYYPPFCGCENAWLVKSCFSPGVVPFVLGHCWNLGCMPCCPLLSWLLPPLQVAPVSCCLLLGAYLQAAARHTATAGSCCWRCPSSHLYYQVYATLLSQSESHCCERAYTDLSLSWSVPHIHATHLLGHYYSAWQRRVVQAVAGEVLLEHAGHTQCMPGAILARQSAPVQGYLVAAAEV
jgi:hypothetical protein